MIQTKLKIAIAILLAIGTDPGWFAHQARAQKPADKAVATIAIWSPWEPRYREGTDLRTAIKTLDKAEAVYRQQFSARTARTAEDGSPMGQLFLAMAHQRLGEPEEARCCLERALRAIEHTSQAVPGAAASLPFGWQRKTELQVLRREAEELLKR
jgi:hypothetical protein